MTHLEPSLKAASASGGGGQSMKKEGQKAPSIDDLKEAGSEEEFKARLKEGQAFRLKEKAGFHVISIDENRPPLVQVVGDGDLIAQMLAFAISEIIESSVKMEFRANRPKECSGSL